MTELFNWTITVEDEGNSNWSFEARHLDGREITGNVQATSELMATSKAYTTIWFEGDY